MTSKRLFQGMFCELGVLHPCKVLQCFSLKLRVFRSQTSDGHFGTGAPCSRITELTLLLISGQIYG